MSFAGANRTGLYRVAEGVQGIVPIAPVFVPTRYTGEGINFNIETVVSQEIRDDRQTTDLVNVGQESSGSFDLEMSFGAFDDLIEAALFGDFTAAPLAATTSTVAITGGTGACLSTANDFVNLVAGQWIKIQGLVANQDDGFYQVFSKADDNNIVLSNPPVTTQAAGTALTITGQMLRNGVSQKSFTLQKRFGDTTVPTFQNFFGMNVNGMSNSFEVGSILTGSIDFMGFGASISTKQVTGARADQAAATGAVMNSVTNLKNIEVDSSASQASILSMSLDVANNLRTQKAIGSLAAVGIGVGRFEVTGSISLYFEDLIEYEKFINSTAFSLSMRVEDPTGNAYIYTFPNVKYESMSLNASGTDTDVILEGSYRGLRDAGTDAMFQIDRLPAVVTDTYASTLDVIQFALAAESVSNTAADITITLTRSGAGIDESTVKVRVVAGGDAVEGVDFGTVDQTVTFPDGSVADVDMAPFTITTDADGDETFFLEIYEPVGTGTTIGLISRTEITITG